MPPVTDRERARARNRRKARRVQTLTLGVLHKCTQSARRWWVCTARRPAPRFGIDIWPDFVKFGPRVRTSLACTCIQTRVHATHAGSRTNVHSAAGARAEKGTLIFWQVPLSSTSVTFRRSMARPRRRLTENFSGISRVRSDREIPQVSFVHRTRVGFPSGSICHSIFRRFLSRSVVIFAKKETTALPVYCL